MKKLLIALISMFLSATVIFASDKKSKILVIVSEANFIELKDGSKHPTGYYLSELMVPVDTLIKSGFEIEFATPTGKTPTMDFSSDDVQYFKNKEEHATLKKLHDSLKNLKHPLALKNMNEKMFAKYSGVFFPGGHAPMTDLYNNSDVGRTLNYFHSTHKPTALICHAPIALLAAGNSNGKWIYSDYKMVGFTNEEEKVAESSFLKGQVKFYLEDELKNKGAEFQETKAWVGKSVWDRELITGQNPMSDRLLVADFISALILSKFNNIKKENTYSPSLKSLSSDSYYVVRQFPKKWNEGYTTIYLGAKPSYLNSRDFSEKLVSHIAHAYNAFTASGLRGYIVYSDGNTEYALMNWQSKVLAEESGKTQNGSLVLKEAQTILNTIVWSDVSPEKFSFFFHK